MAELNAAEASPDRQAGAQDELNLFGSLMCNTSWLELVYIDSEPLSATIADGSISLKGGRKGALPAVSVPCCLFGCPCGSASAPCCL